MGSIIKELTVFGIESDTVKGEYIGRTQEVASVTHHLNDNCTVNLPPFVTHSLDELVWQAREAGAMCVLFILSSTHKKEDIENLFKILDNTVQQTETKRFFWVADRESAEGKKVQAKYGVGGDLPTMLVLVPSHVPQCVEIFNESNIGKKNVAEAFQTAAGLCEALEEERFKLDNRRSLIKAQDKEFLEQEEQSMPAKSSENTNEDHGAKAHRKDQSTPARCHSNEDCDAKARKIREDRQNRVPPEPKKGHFIILRFGDLKFQRKFKTTAFFQEVYDWAGSIESLPLHFTLQRRQEVILHEHQLTEQEVLDVYERVSKTH